jgi:exportin-5
MSGTLLADAVTWLFTSVLKGLQMHGQHDGCMASLVHLAFQIYEALVSRRRLAAWLLHFTLLPGS